MTFYKFLKKGRVIIALAMLILTFVLFIDLYEWIPEDTFNTIIYLQFVPSLLNFLAVFSFITAGGFLVVLLLTLITGRFYCSAICPLGILQDVVTRISRWRSRKRRFFKYKKPHPVWRYSFLGIMTLAIIFGGGWITTWLDPYSIAGRTFTYLFKPVVIWGNNNVLAPVLQSMDIYSVYHQSLIQPYILPVILSIALIGAIGYFAWKRGRIFCNTICPVGTLLGEVSRFSFLKVRFDQDKCTRCGKCAGVCKSECIDIKHYAVDETRCVTCFNCLEICPESALSLRPVSKVNIQKADLQTAEINPTSQGHDENRRKLLVTGLALLTAGRIFGLKKNQMPDSQKDLVRNVREHPVAPPGAGSIKRFNDICTGCSLCVAACPTGVLQPALTEYGLSGFMQPHMDYVTNYCNFDCTKCGEVCPTGAILPIDLEDKHLTQMGKAIFVEQNCIVYTDETDCGACSEHCPTKAVNMVPYKNGLRIPEVDQTICIGCGACEYPCPVDAPFKAIYVNGNPEQVFAEKPEDVEMEQSDSEEDFPF
ncbi:MAG: 4Fe-4S dicluster domain-containing protein [Marinilabilia sp.]